MANELTVIQQKAVSLRSYLHNDKIKATLADALPKWLSIDRMLRIVFSTAMKNPKILECTQESILQSVMMCAQLGLEPILGRAYLIPYQNSKNINGKWVKVYECQMQPGYQGLVDLARRSDNIADIWGHNVYENDEFDMMYGMGRDIHHRPWFMNPEAKRKGPGEIIGAYVVWLLKDGTKHPEFMHISEIHKRRDVSQAFQWAEAGDKSKGGGKKDSVWHKWPEEMNLKTVVKHSSKLVPSSIEFMEAVNIDDQAEIGASQSFGFTYDTGTQQIEQIQQPDGDLAAEFDAVTSDFKQINQFLAPLAKGSNMTIDQVKAEIMRSDDLGRCIENYKTWERVNGQREPDQSAGGAVGAGTDAKSGSGAQEEDQNETAGRQDPGPEKNKAVNTSPTVEEARKWCVENHTLGKYFEDKRLLVETAAASLNIDMKGKLPRQIHQEIINILSKSDEKADEAPPPDNGEFLDGLNYFNEAVAESKMVQGGADVLRQAVDAAGLKTGQRPETLEQCQKFREVYSKLMADHKVGSGMGTDDQETEVTQEVDPEKVWDQLYDLVHQNHPGTNFQLLKSYMKQCADKDGAVIELIAQKYIDDDQFESELMAGFARWRNGDFDKGF